MKCEIIKDLLPIYIEGLCSLETKEEVEAHLKNCPDCQKEYLQLKQDYQAVRPDEEKIEDFLEEKDLLEKSKEAIRVSVIDQGIGKFFSAIAILGISINFVMVVLTFIIYGYQYPKFYFKELGTGQIFILLIPFLPTAMALAGRLAMKKIKNKRTRKISSRIIFTATIPAILLGGIYTLLFIAVPPLGSVTDNPSCYMKLDGELKSFEQAAESFFPAQIPNQAGQVDYHYERYSTLFADNYSLEASWVLPEEEYKTVKEQVMRLSCFKDSAVSDSGGSGTILSTIYPERVTVRFEYHDEERRVGYWAYLGRRY